MTWFSSLFQSGTVFYGDAFPPIISTISDFGYSLLPTGLDFGRSVGSGGTGPVSPKPFAAHDEGPYVDVGDPPVPMDPWVIEAAENPWYATAETVIRSVLPGPVAARQPEVPRPVVGNGQPVREITYEDLEDEFENGGSEDPEIESFPEGDWPKGSIFSPGDLWGPGTWDPYAEPDPVEPYTAVEPHDLDTAPTEDEDMAHDWGHLGRQFLEGLGGFGGPVVPAQIPLPFAGGGGMGGGGGPTNIPGGSAAMPPSGAFRIDQYGRVVRCRRRRRRLLTNSDLKDLAALKTITGNNDALKMAVIKAVR